MGGDPGEFSVGVLRKAPIWTRNTDGGHKRDQGEAVPLKKLTKLQGLKKK